jgi:predicted PurR-regulated permease PerM/methylmalonyl-CoA mutase cobalamin-binding subunit
MPQGVPAHPPRSARLGLLASIVIVVAALYFAKEVLIPLALAVLLSFLLAPLVARLQRLGLSRVPAVIVVAVILSGALAGLGFVVYGQLYDLAEKLPQYKTNIEEKITWVQRFTKGGAIDKTMRVIKQATEDATTKASTAPAATQTTANAPPPPLAPDQPPEKPVPVVITNQPPGETTGTNPFENIYQSFSPMLEPLAMAGIVAIFVIFMLLGREDLRDRLIRLIGQGRINLTTQAMDEAAKRVHRYLLAQCIVNGTYGAAVALGLWLIGVFVGHNNPPFPNWFLWGLLTALLRFIPYIGPWIGAAFPIVISLAVYNGMAVPLAVIIMFVVLELISNNIMEPWLYGSQTGVSTVAILVSAVFWTWLWGTPGLLLATPLTVCIVVMGKYVPQLEFLNILLGDEPALEPKYRFYQRLLAEDVEEADELLAEYLQEKPVVAVYDQVVLPAMALAEADWHRDRLDQRKQQMIRDAVRELVDEIGDRPKKTKEPEEIEKKGDECDLPDASNLPSLAQYDRCILCLPARDEADEISGMIMAQVLTQDGYASEYVSVDKLASEYLDLVEKKRVEVVIVSALPPAAATHARYIVKRLRNKFPDLTIIVGLWTLTGELKRSKQRLAAAGADVVVSSLQAATEQVHQVVQPLLVTERAKQDGEKERATTASGVPDERAWKSEARAVGRAQPDNPISETSTKPE